MEDVGKLKTYRPSGKCAPRGAAVMLGCGLGGAVLACLVIHLIGRLIYVGVVFSLLLGLAVGVSVMVGARVGKCRLPVAAGIVGLGVGLSGYVLIHYLDYCSHVRGFRRAIEKQRPASPSGEGDLRAELDGAMRARWGGSGFSGYLTGWRKGIWRIFWLVEVAIVAGLAGWIPHSASYTPFCEECGRWCEHAPVLVAALDAREKILNACDPENVATIKDMKRVGDHVSRCVVELDFCPGCRRRGYLTVTAMEETGASGTVERVVVSEVDVSGDQLAAVIPDETTEAAAAGPAEPMAGEEISVPACVPEGLVADGTPAGGGSDDGTKESGSGSSEEEMSETPKKDGVEDGKV